MNSNIVKRLPYSLINYFNIRLTLTLSDSQIMCFFVNSFYEFTDKGNSINQRSACHLKHGKKR